MTDQLIELTVRLFSDPAPAEPIPAAYLFGQTPDNQESVHAAGAALFAARRAHAVAIGGTRPLSGYPGEDAWRADLVAHGIPSESILSIPPVDPDALIGTTLTESQAFVAYADRAGYAAAYIVAAPFHQLRSCMTMVSEVLRARSPLRIYSAPGMPLAWLAEVAHSQGTVRGARKGLIAGELERIRRYQEKGDILPTEDILAYFDRRAA